MSSLETIASELAETALKLGAIKVQPDAPFTWASGKKMPLYNDNRLLLGSAQNRRLVCQGLQGLLASLAFDPDVIAGTATAGIPHATTLADQLAKPLVYVRPTPKEHGMGNQIEGPLEPGQTVVVVEDLISTGGSAIKVIEVLRGAGAIVSHCLAIFSYGFPESTRKFEHHDCQLHPLLRFETLMKHLKTSGKLSETDWKALADWQRDPFGWFESRTQ